MVIGAQYSSTAMQTHLHSVMNHEVSTPNDLLMRTDPNVKICVPLAVFSVIKPRGLVFCDIHETVTVYF